MRANIACSAHEWPAMFETAAKPLEGDLLAAVNISLQACATKEFLSTLSPHQARGIKRML